MIQSVTFYVLAVSASLFCVASAIFIIMRSLIGKEAPFIRSPWLAVNILENFIVLDKNSVLFDLGCGDGRVMRAFKQRYPDAKYVGIEKNLFPYLFFWLKNQDIIGRRFAIRRENIFHTDLSGATHVFIYLLPTMMGRLHEKLKAELKDGVKVVTLDFAFNSLTPKDVIKFYDKHKQERLIYIYEF